MNLEFRNIGHRYGDVQALADISLDIASGEIICLLGSSGCGKTTLLHLAAGMQEVQQGEIFADGQLLADISSNPPPERRPIGLVFQEGALFPHLTVAENVNFGLKGSGLANDSSGKWLDQVGLGGFEDRYPHMLSGGQQQRVALARAMAPEPAILLMDEPFANIDVVLRKELRQEALALLRQREATVILVTHDPQEAMDMGDRIAVMEAGHIAQYAPPDDFFDRPATAAIGSLLGGGQIVNGSRNGASIDTVFGSWPVSCLKNRDSLKTKELQLLVHSSMIEIEPGGDNCRVIDARRTVHGQRVIVEARNGDQLTAEIPLERAFDRGNHVSVKAKPGQFLGFLRTD